MRAQALLDEIASSVAAELGAKLVWFHGHDAAPLAQKLIARTVKAGRGPWAGCAVGTRDQGDWIWVALRNLWSRAPRLRVWCYEYPDAYAKHANKRRHELIDRDHRFKRHDAVLAILRMWPNVAQNPVGSRDDSHSEVPRCGRT